MTNWCNQCNIRNNCSKIKKIFENYIWPKITTNGTNLLYSQHYEKWEYCEEEE
jgi:hypothetical protein